MVGVLLLFTAVRIFSQSSNHSVNGSGSTVTYVFSVTRHSFVRPPRHFRYLRVKRVRRSSSYFNHSTLVVVLLLLLSGDIESNPGPDPGEDTIKCVCDSLEETGHMIECEQCFCWSHSDCVNIPSHLASSFPFICPHCVKATITMIPSLRSEISHLRARVIKLENANKSSPNPEIMSVHESVMSLSQHVDSLSCLSNSLPPSNSPIIPSSTIPSSTTPSVSSVPSASAVPGSSQLSSVPSVPLVLPLLSQHSPSHNSKSNYPSHHFLSHLRPLRKPPFQLPSNCHPSLPSLKPPLLPTPQLPPCQPSFQPPPYCHPSLPSSKPPLLPTPQIPLFPNVFLPTLVPNINPNVYPPPPFLQSPFPLAPPSKSVPPLPLNLAQKHCPILPYPHPSVVANLIVHLASSLLTPPNHHPLPII